MVGPQVCAHYTVTTPITTCFLLAHKNLKEITHLHEMVGKQIWGFFYRHTITSKVEQIFTIHSRYLGH